MNDRTSKIMKGMTAAESPVATVLAGLLSAFVNVSSATPFSKATTILC